MNKLHKEFVYNLIPTIWQPGHMGGFLGRLVMRPDPVPNSLLSDVYSYELTNLEWRWYDRIGSYFGDTDHIMRIDQTRYKNLYYMLKKHYTADETFYPAMLYVIAKFTKSYYDKRHKLPTREERLFYINYKFLDNITENQILEMLNTPADFDYTDLYYPYFKCHINFMLLDIVSKLEFRNKIYCKFPPNKSWIPILLYFYKKFYFWIVSDYDPDWGPLEKLPLVQHWRYQKEFFSNLEDNLSKEYSREKEAHNAVLHSYKVIDIYDLVFNKNVEQLSSFDLSFSTASDLSNDRYDLIERVKNDTVQICEGEFGISIEENTSDELIAKIADIFRSTCLKPLPEQLTSMLMNANIRLE